MLWRRVDCVTVPLRRDSPSARGRSPTNVFFLPFGRLPQGRLPQSCDFILSDWTDLSFGAIPLRVAAFPALEKTTSATSAASHKSEDQVWLQANGRWTNDFDDVTTVICHAPWRPAGCLCFRPI